MAAVDYFLKLDGIDGESQDSKHKDSIQLESWSWNETNSGSHASGTGGGAGKVSMADFGFTMTVNKASPKLLLACANGSHIKSGLLTCRKAGKDAQEYLKIKFTDLLVSSFKTGGGSDAVVPVDEISINFAKIEYEYAPQNKDGTLGTKIPVHWDLKEGKGG